jgi:hypothetical protein
MAITSDQLQAQDEAWAKSASEPKPVDTPPEQQSFLQRWGTPIAHVTSSMLDSAISATDRFYATPLRHVGQDIAAGGISFATNLADTAVSAAQSSGKGLAAAEDPAHASDALSQDPISPIWDHAKGAMLDFRDAVAVKDPTLGDQLLQSAAQLMIPFAGYSRALAGLHGAANFFAANALTDATALGPHDPRAADAFALGRQTEGKLGETLRFLAPDGSVLNGWINYIADRTNESEAAGRLKNVLDGAGVGIAGSLLHAVAVVSKQGTAGLRYFMANVEGSGDGVLRGPARQVGAAGWHGSTTPGLEKFDPAALGKDEASASHGRGLYVADNRTVAQRYAASPDSLYAVNIPDEHMANMIEWDKPLTEQPGILEKLKAAPQAITVPANATGQDLMETLGKTPETSAMLEKLGISGVRYPASGKYSQGGDVSRVSVMFNPRHVEIVQRKRVPQSSGLPLEISAGNGKGT